MDPKQFYCKKFELLLQAQAHMEAISELVVELSEHEEHAPNPNSGGEYEMWPEAFILAENLLQDMVAAVELMAAEA